jgi:hypothetical protein
MLWSTEKPSMLKGVTTKWQIECEHSCAENAIIGGLNHGVREGLKAVRDAITIISFDVGVKYYGTNP